MGEAKISPSSYDQIYGVKVYLVLFCCHASSIDKNITQEDVMLKPKGQKSVGVDNCFSPSIQNNYLLFKLYLSWFCKLNLKIKVKLATLVKVT